MIRLFLRVWLVVFIPMLFLLFSNSYNPVRMLNQWADSDYLKTTFGGAFYLLEQDLAQWPQSQWPLHFSQIADKFGRDIRLVTETDMGDEWRSLPTDGYRIIEESGSAAIVKRIGSTPWLVVLMFDESEQRKVMRQAQGPLNLILARFQALPPTQWSRELDALAPHFDFPLQLIDPQQLSAADNKLLSIDQQSQFERQGRVWHASDEGSFLFLKLSMPTEVAADHDQPMPYQVLMAGPIPQQSVHHLWIVGMMIAIFVGGISLCMLIFVAPLWRDLKRLTRTAAFFGEGALSQRATLGRWSAITPLAQSFNQMADQIEKMIQGQRELTNAVAHDLRTPLARLDFAFEMLQSCELDAVERARYEQSVASSLEALDHLIQQLLILSRYRRMVDLVHFHSVDLTSSLRVELNQLQMAHPDLLFEWVVAHDVVDRLIFVDPKAMLRAFNNLAENAVRYAASTVRIRLASSDTHYCLSIEDDGIGIPDVMKPQVFEPFRQLNNEARSLLSTESNRGNQTKTHGLGLAIVKQIAEWHGGEVTLEDSHLGGACFTLRWPIRHP
ncbi:hypothetical protein BFW38_03615 [Terasakiispira papahanaumokuakeensis]|uniref:histidine kinase n=1 Tax=Terasakiispira papahanaumokuakeensis TaxID=197479 RepID=A0A1E2V7F2_9GAMM|nr:ATP-binding protein [Terasakiispira papahanaumokuakeensis]ODC02766.1 hypothetical protein BFW38_03615 [Terasakiispira papahanaumokuakeensis]